MRKGTRRVLRECWPLYLYVLPAIAFTAIFSYFPMFGNVIAFMDYDLFNGWMGLKSPLVGLRNFVDIFRFQVIVSAIPRTVYYSLVSIFVNAPAPILFALLLNELRNAVYKKTVQTISYLPHFVSWVTVSGLVYLFLSSDPSGLFNTVKQFLFGGERIAYMGDARYFVPVMVTASLWKGIGWGSILYLAAITAINPELYEAARVDGAGRWRRMYHVTLPGLLPTFAILLIFGLGNLFRYDFDKVFTLQNDFIRSKTYTIEVINYYKGIQERRYSLSAAIGLFQGVIAFVLTLSANRLSRKVADIGII